MQHCFMLVRPGSYDSSSPVRMTPPPLFPFDLSQDLARMLGWMYDQHRHRAPSNGQIGRLIDLVSEK